MYENEDWVTSAELRLECVKLTIEHHGDVLTTPRERLAFAEVLFKYLKTGEIPA